MGLEESGDGGKLECFCRRRESREREKGGGGEIEGITLARNTDRQLSVEK